MNTSSRLGAGRVVDDTQPHALSGGADDDVKTETRLVAAEGKTSPKKLITLSVLALALAGAGTYFYTQRFIISTDDAQVDADVVAVPARAAGTVKQIHFEENQQVVAGQLLAELDDAPARAKLAQAVALVAYSEAAAHAADVQAQMVQINARSGLAVANAGLRNSTVGAESSLASIAESEARVQNAKARLSEADLNYARTEALFKTGAASTAQMDEKRVARDVARSEVTRSEAELASMKLSRDQAQTRIAEAQAKLKQSDQVEALIIEAQAKATQAHAALDTAKANQTLSELDLSYTQIHAPEAGIVSKKNINLGQTVALGQSVVQLVPNKLWVTANFKETQVDRMQVGQPVRVSVDAYPEHDLHGEIESFSGATGSRFALLPPDNATGNYTKVVQRLSVRVKLSELPQQLHLRPGMSVVAHVDTQGDGTKLAQHQAKAAGGV